MSIFSVRPVINPLGKFAICRTIQRHGEATTRKGRALIHGVHRTVVPLTR